MMYVFYCCYVLQAIQFTGSKKCSYITGFPFYLFLKKLLTFTIELKSNKKKAFLTKFFFCCNLILIDKIYPM